MWGLFLEREKLGQESPEAYSLEDVGMSLRGRHYWWYVLWKIDNPTGKWWEFLRAFVDKEEEEELRERQRREQTVLETSIQDLEKGARKVEGSEKTMIKNGAKEEDTLDGST